MSCKFLSMQIRRQVFSESIKIYWISFLFSATACSVFMQITDEMSFLHSHTEFNSRQSLPLNSSFSYTIILQRINSYWIDDHWLVQKHGKCYVKSMCFAVFLSCGSCRLSGCPLRRVFWRRTTLNVALEILWEIPRLASTCLQQTQPQHTSLILLFFRLKREKKQLRCFRDFLENWELILS